MTQPKLTPPTRAAWVVLEGRDFDAAADLFSLLDDVDEAGTWHASSLDVLADFSAAGQRHVVTVNGRVLAVVNMAGWEVVAVGVSTPDLTSPSRTRDL